MKTVTYDPERWQLVPRVATVDMMNALVASEDNGYTVQRMYQHTIAAAPQHPDTNVYQSTDELVDPLESRDFYKMLQVYVTKTGKIRVFDDSGEWSPPAKKEGT